MTKKNLLMILLLSVLYLLARLSILMFSPDNIYCDTDELTRGALAKEIIEGPMLPILDYPEADSEVYEGGRLLASLITAPFFILFGDSYLSLKLTAVICSLANLILWFILLVRIFNRRTAVIWGLLFIFSPPLYTQASLVTWGAHAEYYFFTPLFLIFLHKILSCRAADETGPGWWAVFGFLSGLSIWIIQNNIVVLTACFLAIFIRDRRFFLKKAFGVYLFFFFIGYSPGIYHYFSRHWQYSIPCDSIFKLYPRSGASHWLPKLKGLIIDHLPKSFLFKPEVISFTYFFVFMSAFFYILWLNRPRTTTYPPPLRGRNYAHKVNGSVIGREFPFLLYFLVYLLAYTFGGLGVWEDDEGYLKYKYVTIIYPFIFFVISFALSKLWGNGRKRLCAAALGFLLLIGLQANIRLISFKDFGFLARQEGFSYYELGDRISGGRTIRGIKSVIGHIRVNPAYGPDFLSGIAAGMAFNRAINKDIEGILSVFSEFGAEYQSRLYKGWGIGLNDIFLEDQEAGAQRLEIISSRIGDEYKKYLYSGLGEGIMTNFVEPQDAEPVLLLISRKAEPSYLKDFYAGVSKGLLNFNKKEREGFIANYIGVEYRHFLSGDYNS